MIPFQKIRSMKNAYQILGVDPTASFEQIKARYRELSVKWHPDRNSSPDAGKIFAEIANAYKVLSDPARRAELDRKISTGLVEDINLVAAAVVETYLDSLCNTDREQRKD